MNNKPLCSTCKHSDVCLFRRRVEKGEKHIINQIQADSTGEDSPRKVIPTIKIGVIECLYFGPKTKAAAPKPNPKPQPETPKEDKK